MVVTNEITDQEIRNETAAANAKFTRAINPSRDLSFFTITVFLPIVAITAALLVGLRGHILTGIGIVCGLVSVAGFARLLYEVSLDIAGFPDYRLPVWTVLYLILYIISAYACLFFSFEIKHKFAKDDTARFMNAVYTSLNGYVGRPQDGSMRFLAISQTILSTFIHVVIITKFVTAF